MFRNYFTLEGGGGGGDFEKKKFLQALVGKKIACSMNVKKGEEVSCPPDCYNQYALAIKLILFSSTIAFLAFQMLQLLFTEERIYFEIVIDVGAQNQRLGSHILNFQLKSGVLAGSVLCTVVLQTSVCAIVA